MLPLIRPRTHPSGRKTPDQPPQAAAPVAAAAAPPQQQQAAATAGVPPPKAEAGAGAGPAAGMPAGLLGPGPGKATQIKIKDVKNSAPDVNSLSR